MRRILAGLALALIVASPVSARANASITGPDGFHFGETAGVTFDAGNAKVDPFDWWARVDCYRNDTTVTGYWDPALGEVVYAEMLHLGDQAGYPVNDNLMTFGPTQSWSGGGADCTVTLLRYDGNGRFFPFATDDFEVLP